MKIFESLRKVNERIWKSTKVLKVCVLKIAWVPRATKSVEHHRLGVYTVAYQRWSLAKRFIVVNFIIFIAFISETEWGCLSRSPTDPSVEYRSVRWLIFR